MKIVNLLLISPLTDISGTAEVARNLYLSLFDLGFQVKLYEIPGWSHLKADLPVDIREKIEFGLSRTDIQPHAAIHFYPPNPYQGIINADLPVQVSYTVFETDKCPILWRDIFNGKPFLENWVACDFHVDSYNSQGVDKSKLRVINFGVDSHRFNPNVEPMEIEGRTKFAFGTSLDWSVRKNPQAMITAFLQEFNNDPDVCFIVKAYTGYGDDAAAEGIRREIATLRNMFRSNAKILFVKDYLHYDTLPKFHKSIDAWVNLSRGEGWDLGSIQSMACGVPVVGSDSSSHKTYLNNENGYPVKTSLLPITSVEFLSKNSNFIGHSWWEPNVKDARRQMRQVYEDWKNKDAYESKSKAARQKALDFPWKRTAVRAMYEIGKFFK